MGSCGACVPSPGSTALPLCVRMAHCGSGTWPDASSGSDSRWSHPRFAATSLPTVITWRLGLMTDHLQSSIPMTTVRSCASAIASGGSSASSSAPTTPSWRWRRRRTWSTFMTWAVASGGVAPALGTRPQSSTWTGTRPPTTSRPPPRPTSCCSMRKMGNTSQAVAASKTWSTPRRSAPLVGTCRASGPSTVMEVTSIWSTFRTVRSTSFPVKTRGSSSSTTSPALGPGWTAGVSSGAGPSPSVPMDTLPM
mmetsp:Transcript_105800/g.182482  ORF Transcript_105800/g.182482 Transcript_105800/m.182482 type:complete len:251 (-) Transcript_105800:611-1363(-)